MLPELYTDELVNVYDEFSRYQQMTRGSLLSSVASPQSAPAACFYPYSYVHCIESRSPSSALGSESVDHLEQEAKLSLQRYRDDFMDRMAERERHNAAVLKNVHSFRCSRCPAERADRSFTALFARDKQHNLVAASDTPPVNEGASPELIVGSDYVDQANEFAQQEMTLSTGSSARAETQNSF